MWELLELIYYRAKLWAHDTLIVMGFLATMFWIGVAIGQIHTIFSLPGTDRVWAFNMEGKDYIQKK